MKQAIKEAEAEVDALKKVDKEQTAQGSKVRQEAKRLEVLLGNVVLKRDEILKKAQLEEVTPPPSFSCHSFGGKVVLSEESLFGCLKLGGLLPPLERLTATICRLWKGLGSSSIQSYYRRSYWHFFPRLEKPRVCWKHKL